ncbi:MAG: yajC [Bacteroidota bacterium]|nr:yajC [Bacteroidota bacterium]
MGDPIMLLFLGAFLVIFWLFFIRPQTKAANQAKEFQANLEKGTRIVTSGGIHGRIVKTEDNTILLEVDNNVKIKIEKSAISMEMTKAAYTEVTDKKPEQTSTK